MTGRNTNDEVFNVPGLVVIPGALSEAQHDGVVELVDRRAAEVDTTSTSGRGQLQFGRSYEWRTKRTTVTTPLRAEPLIVELAELAAELLDGRAPDSCILNIYGPDGFISSHADAPKVYGPVVVGFNLLEDWPLHLRNAEGKVVRVAMPVRSAVVMGGESRHGWTHEVRRAKRTSDGAPRRRRLNLTYRTVPTAAEITEGTQAQQWWKAQSGRRFGP